jgi:TatD DNase family protein
MLIDSHAHINDEQFAADDVQAIIDRAKANDVAIILNAGDSIASSRAAMELAAKHAEIYALAGIHPEEAAGITEGDYAKLAEYLAAEKVVGVGEIGLDYHWKTVPKDEQKRVFIRQLDMAKQLHLPVCVHDREAHGDTLEIIKREGRGVRGVMHCFSGSLEMARELLKLGWYLGADGPLTFKNAAKLPEIVAKLPLDCLLVETDCPYLAPVPMRGKRNEPAYVKYVAEFIAQLKNISYEEVAEQTTANACNLYNIKL